MYDYSFFISCNLLNFVHAIVFTRFKTPSAISTLINHTLSKQGTFLTILCGPSIPYPEQTRDLLNQTLKKKTETF